MNGKFMGCANGVIRVDNRGTVVELPVSNVPPTVPPSRECEVTRNGQPAALADLKRGDDVTLDGKPVVAIVATGSGDPKAKANKPAAPISRAQAVTAKGGKK